MLRGCRRKTRWSSLVAALRAQYTIKRITQILEILSNIAKVSRYDTFKNLFRVIFKSHLKKEKKNYIANEITEVEFSRVRRMNFNKQRRESNNTRGATALKQIERDKCTDINGGPFVRYTEGDPILTTFQENLSTRERRIARFATKWQIRQERRNRGDPGTNGMDNFRIKENSSTEWIQSRR